MDSTKYYITTVSWYNQLKIKSKALVGISVICVLFIVSLSLSIHLVNKIHQETKEIHSKWMQSILKISKMMNQLELFRKFESIYELSNEEAEKRTIEVELEKLRIDFVNTKNSYYVLSFDREEKILYEKFSSDMDEFLKTHSTLIHSSTSLNKNRLNELRQKSKFEIGKVADDLHELISFNQQGELESNQIVEKSYYSLLVQMIVTAIFTILFIYLVIYYTFKQFIFPLQLAEKATNQIAKGDWRVRIEYESKDELGNFIKTFNQMVIDHRKIDQEKTRIEKEMGRNEELFRTLIETSHDAILLIGLDYSIIWVNTKMLRMFGYESMEELRELSAIDFTIPSEKSKIISIMSSLLNSEYNNFSYESTAIRKDKTCFPIEIQFAIYQNDNINVGILTDIRDITERKEIQKEISEKSQMLSGILTNMPVVVFRINEEGIVTQSTGAGFKKMGLMENQSINVNIFEMYSEFKNDLHKALQGEPQAFISSGLYKENNKWFFQNYFFLDESTGGLIGFGLDITEQVVAQKAAEEASKIKGEFLANISHEIRTPMNAIIGFSEILLESISDEIQKQYLENIVSSGKTLLALINDILDLSKVESGKLELELSSVNITSVFKELKNIFLQKINEKKLELQLIIDPSVPEEILLDELRFRQIFINLLSNAIKFTDTGYIRLTANAYKKQEDGLHIDLIFTVEDTGIGIPLEEQSVIFEAFTQQKGQSHARYGGTGLGLAISNRLVQLMNGSISIKSEIGKGSIFQIIIKNVLLPEELSLSSSHIINKTNSYKQEELILSPSSYLIEQSNIESLKPLLEEMENDLLIESQKLSEFSSINEIEEFAYKIKYLGNKYNYPPLLKYADNLQSKALLFDMKSLLDLLRKYPVLLNELRINYDQ